MVFKRQTQRKNLVKAEALGMRALAHYYLLVAFSPTYNSSALGCAYVTSSDDYIMPSRLSMKDSYDKVNADLDQAIALFPTTLPAGYGELAVIIGLLRLHCMRLRLKLL